MADEFYFACGWVSVAYCELVARYRNYVVDFRVDHQAELGNNKSQGLTYAEIEHALIAVDSKITEKIDTLPTPAP